MQIKCSKNNLNCLLNSGEASRCLRCIHPVHVSLPRNCAFALETPLCLFVSFVLLFSPCVPPVVLLCGVCSWLPVTLLITCVWPVLCSKSFPSKSYIPSDNLGFHKMASQSTARKSLSTTLLLPKNMLKLSWLLTNTSCRLHVEDRRNKWLAPSVLVVLCNRPVPLCGSKPSVFPVLLSLWSSLCVLVWAFWFLSYFGLCESPFCLV